MIRRKLTGDKGLSAQERTIAIAGLIKDVHNVRAEANRIERALQELKEAQRELDKSI